MARSSPQLIFFTELDAAGQQALLARPEVIDRLTAHGDGIALAIHELSPTQAAVVRLLNARSVPLTAWLLLTREAGYWINVDNYPQAIARFHAFREWADAERLTFAAVGLDMQPSSPQRQRLHTANPFEVYDAIVAARNNALFPAAYEAYHDLIAEIRSDGYVAHTYQYPFVVDDRRAGTTLVQRALNVVALPVELEVLMCYSSLVPRWLGGSSLGSALIAEYGVYADAIGIGTTGGGTHGAPQVGEPAERLSWTEFTRDLRVAARYTDTIHVFSLEGCVENDYVARLEHFDWHAPVVIPTRFRVLARLLRLTSMFILGWSRVGLAFMGWLGWVVVAVIMVRRLLRRLRRQG